MNSAHTRWFAALVKVDTVTPFVGGQVTICDAFGYEIPEGCHPTYISKKTNKGKRGRPAKPQTETRT